MNSSNKNISLNNIWQLITVILSFHYFLSYRWINGLLEIYGLDGFSIITIQDVMFPFAGLNYTIIGLCSIGFIVIFYFKFILTNETYLKADIIFKKNFKEGAKEIFKHKSIKSTLFKIVAFLIISISTIILFRNYLKIPENGGYYIFWFLVLFILIPVIYVIWVKKRTLILGAFLFLTFLWANQFIDKILIDSKNTTPTTITNVSFNYHNKNIKTNDSLVFLYRSYEFLILRDKKTKKNMLFENENVSFLEIQKDKIN